MKINYKNESWKLEEREADFLYPYLFRFYNKYNIPLNSSSIKISGDLLKGLRSYIREALLDLIQDCYSAPSIKQRQKDFLLFRKFIFEDNKIVVNYTTSVLGRLIYTIYLRITFIDNILSENGELLITDIENSFTSV